MKSNSFNDTIYKGYELVIMNSKYPWGGCIKFPNNFNEKKDYLLEADMSIYNIDNGRGYVAVEYQK